MAILGGWYKEENVSNLKYKIMGIGHKYPLLRSQYSKH